MPSLIVSGMTDAWDLAQYERYRTERLQPFVDLLKLIEPLPDLRAVDLGCGAGEGTALFHAQFQCQSTLGIDASPAMLAGARAQPAVAGLRFAEAHIERPHEWCAGPGSLDVILSNAAVHWVPEHVPLLATFAEQLSPRGQLAIQMPVNGDHPSHQVMRALCASEPWAAHFAHAPVESPVLPPEQYSRLLHRLGFSRHRVFVEVYVHLLDGVDGVVEWVKGSILTEPRKRLPAGLYASFEDDYRRRLSARIVDERPFPYTLKRLFLWAARGP
jgi:trans-aconitate 2-methyltransferase